MRKQIVEYTSPIDALIALTPSEILAHGSNTCLCPTIYQLSNISINPTFPGSSLPNPVTTSRI